MRIWATLLSIAALGTASAEARSGPAVTIDTGRLQGTAENGVVAFRGIPYSAPPVGPLRWKAPRAAPAWQGVRDASRYGMACPQDGAHKEPWARVGATGEDCLFLNVWRPAKPGRYPVMVFFHGGGFTYGAAGVPLYDGARLARQGVVLVTINYRLGRLGFFAHPALTAEDPQGLLGNYGLMDAVESLRWVRRNIARFAGDPNNVTIFGESAGAGFVQLLMGSPGAAGLFHKAISESGAGGAALSPIRGAPQSAEAVGARWAEGIGLKNATPDQLRALPLPQLLGRSFPFIDGRVIVASPGVPFQSDTAFKLPMIVGANSNEGTLPGNNDQLARAVLGDRYPAAAAAYAAARPGMPDKVVRTDLAEDALSILPSFSNAAMHAANGAAAYAYYFTQVPANLRAGSAGSPHGGEIEYLFGNPDEGSVWDAADWRTSRELSGYWVRFARTGDPNGGGAPAWPRIGTALPRYLVIGEATHAATLTPDQEAVRKAGLDFSFAGWVREKR